MRGGAERERRGAAGVRLLRKRRASRGAAGRRGEFAGERASALHLLPERGHVAGVARGVHPQPGSGRFGGLEDARVELREHAQEACPCPGRPA